MEQQQVDYVNQSLLNQVADYARRLAVTEARLTEAMQELEAIKQKDGKNENKKT